MIYEVEICVKYLGTKEEIFVDLKNKGFKLLEEFKVVDTYMINKNLDIHNISTLDYLSKCVMIRDFIGIKKYLQCKFKEFDKNGDILKQGKVKCPITDIHSGMEFLQALNYIPLFNIVNNNYIYTNGINELYVQDIEDQGIYIEMEQENLELDNLNGNTIDEMKEILKSYNFNIDTSNFFVKKAEEAIRKLK